jgi:PIN domain nuclease of toxin-antitoxin system
MRLVLDTHVLLWAASDPDRIAVAAREAIADGENEVFVSAISAWEIAIKQAIGKLELARPAEAWVPEVIERSGFEALPVGLQAALRVRSLPFHHRDPFDRLLVAQAIHEGLTIVTHDEIFASYDVGVLRA